MRVFRAYSWLLLAGLVSATLAASYNQYGPPTTCVPKTRYSEVTSYVTRTATVVADRLTTVVQYSTHTALKYVPTTIYRDVTTTAYQQVTNTQHQVVTDTQVKPVVKTSVLPDRTVTSTVTVYNPTDVYRDYIKTEYVTKNVVNTKTVTVTKVKTEQITYSQPPPVTKVHYSTYLSSSTHYVVSTKYNTVVSTVVLPPVTNTVYKEKTQVSAA